jgi:hypothetical protein
VTPVHRLRAQTSFIDIKGSAIESFGTLFGMPRAQSGVIGLLLATLFAACSLTTSFDGLSTTPPPDGAVDGSVRPNTDGAAGRAEGGALPGDGRWCTTVPDASFCEDFDDPSATDPGAHFSGPHLVPAGSIGFDTAVAESAPRSAVMRLTSATGCGYANLEKEIVGTFHELHVAFSARIGDAAGTGAIPDGYFAGFYYNKDAQADFYCAHHIRASRDYNVQSPLPNGDFKNESYTISRSVPAGQWLHYAIDVVASGTGSKITIRIDGELVLQDLQRDGCPMGGNVGLFLGHHCTDGTVEARFDNVTLTGK